MNVALMLALVVLIGLVSYYLLFPPNRFLIFTRRNGGKVVVSRSGLEFERPPDRFPAGGVDQIESYVSRLVASPQPHRFIGFFTPAGDRGFGLHARGRMIEATLSCEWHQEPEREASIREFFGSLGIAPMDDYLAGNGNVPDATRLLSYPITGSSAEVAALAKRILVELCAVSASEALNIRYSEKQ
jgi:hypothetical protein